MFSVENLYYILYVNLFKKIKAHVHYFWKFGSNDVNDFIRNFPTEEQHKNLELVLGSNLTKKSWLRYTSLNKTLVYFCDQEPVTSETLDNVLMKYSGLNKYGKLAESNHLVITSEHSELITEYCKKHKSFQPPYRQLYHLYYFFHGFASLYWFSDCYYFDKILPDFKNKFISFNRLCKGDRSYRLFLVSQLKIRNIINKGKVSLQLIDNNENILKKEIFNFSSRLSSAARKEIWSSLNGDQNYEIDKKVVLGSASADLGPVEYKTWQESFLHVVSETVFFDKKLHLTEKIFKPIVSRRPFILLGAYKNLEYLKSYGFKTFSKWIDESYDEEQDNEKRLMMVCDEVEKIANLPENKIETMYWDMQEVLDYNYRHFYTDFKKILVDELVDNFEDYLHWHNNNAFINELYDIDSLNLPEVKKLLAQ